MKVPRYFGKPSFNPHTSIKRGTTLAAMLMTALLTGAAPTLAQQNVGGVDIFPASNIWNMKIDNLPVDKNSSGYVSKLGASSHFHPNWGVNDGIPYNIVSGPTTQIVDFSSGYPDESDVGPYPTISAATTLIEGGTWDPNIDGDRHVLFVNTTNHCLYELYETRANPATAQSGAIFPLSSNALRPDSWTSADAAGLPIFPALINYDETSAGPIKHALRFTGSEANGHIWPARHSIKSVAGYPPFGQRFRLKKSFNISAFTTDVLNRRILTAMQEYGMFFADRGSSWFVQGAPDPRWNDTTLHELTRLKGSDFEAVDESAYMITPDSAIAGLRKPAPKPVPIPGKPWPKFK
ncbi:MAG: hypothetical protein JST01_28995 [Cyanobacteria bacterium SZAS TMP-1]|nr:hypothetical protein [Cyanobacteria bacterium SZAS TMP-1]